MEKKPQLSKRLKNNEELFVKNFSQFINETNALINCYDNHNIFILPSFTEAHPKVIDESLARSRPVIIFEEIKHIIQNKNFLSKTVYALMWKV